MPNLPLQSLQPQFFDWGWLAENFFEDVWPAFIGHLYLSFVSVGIALVISLPIGILVSRYRKLYTPVLFITGFFFTIPSLALFAILVTVPGIGIGPRAAIIGLVSYSLLVLIRNVVTGIDSVAPETIDAAKGMGLTPAQILFHVELPLALPVIVAGIRIATVTVIGIAVIGGFIAAGGLGQLIFDGIDRSFPTLVFTGAAMATILAITADVSLLFLERYMRPWARRARGAN